MKSILSRIESNIDKERLDDSDMHDMTLIHNEIEEELSFTPAISFDLTTIDPQNITLDAVESARNYIDLIRSYYIEVSKRAVEARDRRIMAFENADREGFILMKKHYTNETLEEFVRNENEKNKIKRYDDRLYSRIMIRSSRIRSTHSSRLISILQRKGFSVIMPVLLP